MSEPLVSTVELNTRLAMPVVAACRVARFVIGEERALRIAQWAGLRLTRWRCSGHRRWQWIGADPLAPSLWFRTWTMAVIVVIPTALVAAALIGGAVWVLLQ